MRMGQPGRDPRDDALAQLVGMPGRSMDPRAAALSDLSDPAFDDYDDRPEAFRRYEDYVMDAGSDADPNLVRQYREAAAREAGDGFKPIEADVWVGPSASIEQMPKMAPDDADADDSGAFMRRR